MARKRNRESLQPSVSPPPSSALSPQAAAQEGSSSSSSSKAAHPASPLKPQQPAAAADVCVICLEDVVDQCAKLDACSHRFHVDCILKWSKVENTCPQCKARFEEIETTEADSGGSEEKKGDGAGDEDGEPKAKRRKIPVERRDQRIDSEFAFDASPEILHLLNSFMRFAQEGPPPGGPQGGLQFHAPPVFPQGAAGGGGGPRFGGLPVFPQGGGGGGPLFGVPRGAGGGNSLLFPHFGDFSSFMEALAPPPLPPWADDHSVPSPSFVFGARRAGGHQGGAAGGGGGSAFAGGAGAGGSAFGGGSQHSHQQQGQQQAPNSRVPNTAARTPSAPSNTQAVASSSSSSSSSSRRNHPPPFPPPPPPAPPAPRMPNHADVSAGIAPAAALGFGGLSSAQSLSSSPSRFDASQSNSVGVFSSQQPPQNNGSCRLHQERDQGRPQSGSSQRPRSARSGSEPLLPSTSSRQSSRGDGGNSGSSERHRDPPPADAAGEGEDADGYEWSFDSPAGPFSMLLRNVLSGVPSPPVGGGEQSANSDSQPSVNNGSGSASNASSSASAGTIPSGFRSFFIPFGATQSSPRSSDASASGSASSAPQEQQRQQAAPTNRSLGPGISVRQFTFHSHVPGSLGPRSPSSQSQASQNPFAASVFSSHRQSPEQEVKMSDDSVGSADTDAASPGNGGSGTAAATRGAPLLRTPTASSTSGSSTSYSYVAPPRRSSRLNFGRSTTQSGGPSSHRGPGAAAASSARGSRGTTGSRSGSGLAGFLRQRERASMSHRRQRPRDSVTYHPAPALPAGGGIFRMFDPLRPDPFLSAWRGHQATAARRPPSASAASSSASATSGANAHSGSASSGSGGVPRRSSFFGQLPGSSFLTSLRSFFASRFGGGNESTSASSSSPPSAAAGSSDMSDQESSSSASSSARSTQPDAEDTSRNNSSSSSLSQQGAPAATAASRRAASSGAAEGVPSQSQQPNSTRTSVSVPDSGVPPSGDSSGSGPGPGSDAPSISPPFAFPRFVPVAVSGSGSGSGALGSSESFSSFISGNGLGGALGGGGVPQLRRVPMRRPDGTVSFVYTLGMRVPVARNRGNADDGTNGQQQQ